MSCDCSRGSAASRRWTRPRHWLPGQARDAEFCRQALADIPRCDWLVVDHYALDHRWQQAMRVATGKLMVIDDLADRRHACDLLLDQNLHDAGAARYDSLLAADAVRLCGPRYALLGEGFRGASAALPRDVAAPVKKC